MNGLDYPSHHCLGVGFGMVRLDLKLEASSAGRGFLLLNRKYFVVAWKISTFPQEEAGDYRETIGIQHI